MAELRKALKKMKNNKSPGPDDIRIELFKAMDEESLALILHTINEWRKYPALPKTLSEADVITIFKKGNVEEPGKYRPIALLQTLYKIHAAMFRNRLIEALDSRIIKGQYGFRQGRSTAQPLFIARRLIDISEASNSKLYLTLLDWEKAFDKIDQEELVNAVRRLNVPKDTLEELEALYAEITFRIRDAEGTSTERKQRTGIRQGCPLSPYLFIILMTALMMDVSNEVGNVETTASKDAGTTNLLYADDTLLISSTAATTNIMLAAIVKHSDRYGLRLNEAKCEVIAINAAVNTKGKDKVKFPDGREVGVTKATTYLGGQLRMDGAAKPEIENRLSKAATVFRKLTALWSDSACSTLWKLRVCNAVVFTVLTYGLETVPFTKALESRVNYFQAKCYRNILKTQAAFYSRVSDKEILDKVSMILHSEPGRTPMISRQIADKAVILLGHIIRSDKDDHMRRVAIDAEFKRVERTRRRVGRPRFYWLQNTMSRAYKLMRKRQGLERREFDIRNGFQRAQVANAALGREHPFDKKRKKPKIRRSRKDKTKRPNNGVKNDKFQKKKHGSQHREKGRQKKNGCDGHKTHQQHNRHRRQQQEAHADHNRSVGIAQLEERELISSSRTRRVSSQPLGAAVSR
jgi:hypothetical protein